MDLRVLYVLGGSAFEMLAGLVPVILLHGLITKAAIRHNIFRLLRQYLLKFCNTSGTVVAGMIVQIRKHGLDFKIIQGARRKLHRGKSGRYGRGEVYGPAAEVILD